MSRQKIELNSAVFSVLYGQFWWWVGKVCSDGHGGGERGCCSCLVFLKYKCLIVSSVTLLCVSGETES